MKNRYTLAVLFGFIGCMCTARAAVEIEIDAGDLYNSTGTAFVPVGGLLQLIASPSGNAANLVAPTANSFVGGDNIVVMSFSMNYGFAPGETDSVVTFNLQNTGAASPDTFDLGDPLLLRWYPTLTATATAPGLGTTYGQFRSDTGENGGTAWVTPADGSALTFPNGLNFNTVAAGGSHAELTGFATNIVLTSDVPEPSSYALLGAGIIAAIGVFHYKRVQKRIHNAI